MQAKIGNVKSGVFLEVPVVLDSKDQTPIETVVRFRMPADDQGTNAEVSFDGKIWHPVALVKVAIQSFSETYPFAFDKGE